MSTLKDEVKDGSIIATDKAFAYSPVQRALNVAVHNRYDANPGKRGFLGGTINRINSLHTDLKLFIKKVQGCVYQASAR